MLSVRVGCNIFQFIHFVKKNDFDIKVEKKKRKESAISRQTCNEIRMIVETEHFLLFSMEFCVIIVDVFNVEYV